MKTKKTTRRKNCAYVKPLYTKAEFLFSAKNGTLAPERDSTPLDVAGGRRLIVEGYQIDYPDFFLPISLRDAYNSISYNLSEETREKTKRAIEEGKIIYHIPKKLNAQTIANNGLPVAFYFKPGEEKRAELLEKVLTDDVRNHVLAGRLFGYREDDINCFLRHVGEEQYGGKPYSAAMRQYAAAEAAGVKAAHPITRES